MNVENEFFDPYVIEPSDLTGGDRPLWELAAAIRRRDWAEAEIHLDRIAEIVGPAAVEEVQQGRFGPRARGAAHA